MFFIFVFVYIISFVVVIILSIENSISLFRLWLLSIMPTLLFAIFIVLSNLSDSFGSSIFDLLGLSLFVIMGAYIVFFPVLILSAFVVLRYFLEFGLIKRVLLSYILGVLIILIYLLLTGNAYSLSSIFQILLLSLFGSLAVAIDYFLYKNK